MCTEIYTPTSVDHSGSSCCYRERQYRTGWHAIKAVYNNYVLRLKAITRTCLIMMCAIGSVDGQFVLMESCAEIFSRSKWCYSAICMRILHTKVMWSNHAPTEKMLIIHDTYIVGGSETWCYQNMLYKLTAKLTIYKNGCGHQVDRYTGIPSGRINYRLIVLSITIPIPPHSHFAICYVCDRCFLGMTDAWQLFDMNIVSPILLLHPLHNIFVML